MKNNSVEKNFKEAEDFDLLRLLLTLWREKYLLLIVGCAFSLAGVAYSLSLTNVYRSSVTLVVRAETNPGGGGLNGLASIAGLQLSQSTASTADLAIEVLGSRKFIREYLSKYGFSKRLIAVNGWDVNQEVELWDLELFDPENGQWSEGSEPSGEKTLNAFKKNMEITYDRKTGIVLIECEHYSPLFAYEVCRTATSEINSYMRERALRKSEKIIEYLKEEVVSTPVSELRKVNFSLLEEEMKKGMLARVENDYVFEMVDPPIVPLRKYGPRRSLICIVGSVLGVFFGLMLISLKYVLIECKRASF